MKMNILLMCFLVLLGSGCNDILTNTLATPIPQQTQNELNENTSLDNRLKNTPTPQAKISSDFENAPTVEQVEKETGKKISAVLLQDTLTYTIPTDKYFAISLEEDAEKAYRWLLVEDNEFFKFEEETHINGYRVFIFRPLEQGETSILFELSQDAVLIETLSYQIVFS